MKFQKYLGTAVVVLVVIVVINFARPYLPGPIAKLIG